MGLEPTTSRLTVERICQIELPRIAENELRRTPRPPLGCDAHDTCLDFGMAVSAEKRTFRRLRSRFRKRSGDAGVPQRELLAGGIQMVELERPDMPGVAAEHTGSPVFGDQSLLDPPPTVAHSLRVAPPAAIPVAPAMESRHTVMNAVHLDGLQGRIGTSIAASSEARSQSIPGQPVPNVRRAGTGGSRDRSDRLTSGNPALEFVTIHADMMPGPSDGSMAYALCVKTGRRWCLRGRRRGRSRGACGGSGPRSGGRARG